jgi:SAM-dependent methyltransferase
MLLQCISLSNFIEVEKLHALRGEVIREWDQWATRDREVLRQRYDRIANFIPLFDWVLFQPAGLRKHAVDRLKLRRGDRVLEVGCGTGRNFALLRERSDQMDVFMASTYLRGCCARPRGFAIVSDGGMLCSSKAMPQII